MGLFMRSWWMGEGERATAKAKAKCGVLRFAQNDDVKQTTATTLKQAAAKAKNKQQQRQGQKQIPTG
jgi:hypothetical protein